MSSRLQIGLVAAALVAMVGSLAPVEASAQAAGRYRVMVTNLSPQDARDNFGKDLAKELRKLINQLPTHMPVEEKEIKNAAKRFDMDMKELNCITSLQLATQIQAELVMCGTYTEDRDAKTVSLQGLQFAAPGGVSFAIEDKTWGEKEYDQAAMEIFSSFEGYVEQLRYATFCGQDYESKQFAEAEPRCRQAIEMNPEDSQTRYILARVLMELDRNEEAYGELQTVIEKDPLHEGALQTAGYVAATINRPDEARGYYNTYLQLNPGNANVRMTVAYDLATAGDAEGAMILIEEGFELDPENVDMRLMHAAFAVNAAAAAKQGYEPTDEAPLPPTAVEYYEKALESYGAAYEVNGAEMEASALRNMIVSNMELGRFDAAKTMAEAVLETHGEEASIWSTYAELLVRMQDTDGAVAALDRVAELQPDYPNLRARQGRMLIGIDGREEEAVEYLREAVASGEQTSDAMGNLIFATGHTKGSGAQPKNWGYAIRMFEIAKTFELSERTQGQVDFWHAYSLYNLALEQQKPGTLESARATLPRFQTALRLFQSPSVAGYASSQPSITLQQFLDASQTYIEIQEAIIQRGSR